MRRVLTTAKDGASESLAQAAATNSPAGAVDRLIVQYTSSPLSGNQTIAGAIKGQVLALESNAAADLDVQMVIWVMKSDATVRGTLIASNTTALGHEFNTTARNISLPKGGSTTPTSVAALSTDRIVVELGYRKHESAVTSRTGTFTLGNLSGGTDLPVDETDTTATKVPWIEFTENLVFAATTERVTQDVIEVMGLPADAIERVTQDVIEVMGLPADAIERVTQDVIEVMGLPDDATERVTQQVIEVMVTSPDYAVFTGRPDAMIQLMPH